MDPQASVLRPYILVTTLFVLVGASAGFAVFLAHRAQSPPDEVRTPGGSGLDAVVLRHLDAPDGVDEATLARIDALVQRATNEPLPATRDAANAELVELGAKALPALLNELRDLGTRSDAFEEPRARHRLGAIDISLRSIRERVAPGTRTAQTGAMKDAATALRRAKAWYVWWDEYLATHPRPF